MPALREASIIGLRRCKGVGLVLKARDENGGGLLNAIVGSLIMTVLAILFGTPIGILAGTYMAEYGRHTRLTQLVRFINDILLSAPSIVVSLFIYEIMVRPMGHFSGISGAVVLAVRACFSISLTGSNCCESTGRLVTRSMRCPWRMRAGLRRGRIAGSRSILPDPFFETVLIITMLACYRLSAPSPTSTRSRATIAAT
jgi:hypothetical protein